MRLPDYPRKRRLTFHSSPRATSCVWMKTTFGVMLNPDAVALLLGGKDWPVQMNRLVTVDGKLAGSLEKLLSTTAPTCFVFNTARRFLINSLSDRPDLLSHTPLEAAYLWTLSARWANAGMVVLGDLQL